MRQRFIESSTREGGDSVGLTVTRGMALTTRMCRCTRKRRQDRVRPPCVACAPAKGRAAAVIAHPPGVERQWEWLPFPDPPVALGVGHDRVRHGGIFCHGRDAGADINCRR
jgi:hypothetical protein